jgi:hypothetical protein
MKSKEIFLRQMIAIAAVLFPGTITNALAGDRFDLVVQFIKGNLLTAYPRTVGDWLILQCPCEQNGPVPLSADGSQIGSKSYFCRVDTDHRQR